jgi:low affinity Fe/Cu permease
VPSLAVLRGREIARRRHLAPFGAARRRKGWIMASSVRSESSESRTGSSGSGGLSAWFSRFAGAMAKAVGHPMAFIIALGFVIVWAISGPIFGFSDTWQLIINTTTTIITSLIVFLIQNTQNRDTAALQLKIDELIRIHKDAHNAVLDLEELEESDLTRIRDRYERLARSARERREGILDENSPAVSEEASTEVQPH